MIFSSFRLSVFSANLNESRFFACFANVFLGVAVVCGNGFLLL